MYLAHGYNKISKAKGTKGNRSATFWVFSVPFLFIREPLAKFLKYPSTGSG